MRKSVATIQKVSEKLWTDEKGQQIPVTRIDSLEKFQEKAAGRIWANAINLNDQLQELKAMFQELSEEVYQRTMERHKIKKPGKGNFTFFNFDRSIKVEVNINENIVFEDALIIACQSKLNEFLDAELSDKQDYFRSLINDAFSKQRGGLDAKKVLGLLKHRTKIKAALFQEALDLLEQSIRRPNSKTYYRVSERMEDGGYKVVDLNFSSI
jgi:hypothetical protein